jgi:hypothetical protein
MNRGENNFFYRLAQVVSIVFHPVFMPLYGLLIMFSAPTLLSFIPLKIKFLTLLVVVINNIILPLSITLVLYSRGVIKTIYAREKNERTILLLITFALYLITTLLMLKLPVPNLVKAYFVSTTFVTFVTIIINFIWKLSLHSVAVGGLLTLVCFMAYLFEVPVTGYLAGMVLLSGIVMFSRLYNEDHQPGEVWAGFFTGILSMVFSLFFLL